jgi:hypothetical protein
MTECRHPAITVFMEEGGGPIRMWACSDCRIRFYPACKVCVSVGHRGEEHVEDEDAARLRKIEEAARALADTEGIDMDAEMEALRAALGEKP